MAKFNEYPSKATPEDADTLMLYDTATKSNKLSPFSGIWNWIVGKLTNAVISSLQTNNKTVLGAINELNSNKFKKIPVNITIENTKLSVRFSIGDTENGLICLTFAVSNSVYACALINYGSAYSAKLISAEASNASNFQYTMSDKVLTCDMTLPEEDVHDINAFLIK